MEGHVWGKGEDREVVGAAQTEEGLLHLEGTGRGEGETTVKSGEGEVTL